MFTRNAVHGTTLFDLLSEGKIEPIVAERSPLVEARRAHEALGQGGLVGKQVLICDSTYRMDDYSRDP